MFVRRNPERVAPRLRLASEDATPSGLRLHLTEYVFVPGFQSEPWAGISEHLRC